MTTSHRRAAHRTGAPRATPARIVGTAERTYILGVPIDRLSRADALARVGDALDAASPAMVAYVNAHSVNVAQRRPDYLGILQKADLVLNDGVGVRIAARLHHVPVVDNLNGTDFNPEILRIAAERDLGVYLFGGRPGVATAAGEVLAERIPGLRIVGATHGHRPSSDYLGVAADVRRTGAEVLFVGLGNPLQELWLNRYQSISGSVLGVAVGGFLDFSAGVVPRAPGWVQELGLEWGWRLAQEPRRLFGRYVVGNPVFLTRVMASRVEIAFGRGRGLPR